VGLRSFEVTLPDQQELERVLSRVQSAGVAVEPDPAGSLIRDPSGNGVLLRVA
jgi:catechol-2,3-dioxygenase